MRSRAGKKTEFVLCVTYKGKPTHHLIKKNEETGFYGINGKQFGEYKKLADLIKHLGQPGVKNWWVMRPDQPVLPDTFAKACHHYQVCTRACVSPGTVQRTGLGRRVSAAGSNSPSCVFLLVRGWGCVGGNALVHTTIGQPSPNFEALRGL